MHKTLFILVVATAALVVPATPALAHGSSGPDATNFVSTIKEVVTPPAEGAQPVPASVSGITWRVIGRDSLLEVENRSGKELTVIGYSGEPYLRIGPRGVWENRNSPAAYINQERFGEIEVPANLSPQTKPNWVRVGDEPVFAWHDHRIHWMSRTDPPQVASSGADRVKVFDWSIPFMVDEQQLLLSGALTWVRPEPVWPWLLGMLALTTLPLGLALRYPPGIDRRRALLRTAAATLVVLVAINVVHAVDDILALPATFWENVVASAQSGLFLAGAVVGAYVAWRRVDSGWLGILIGAGMLAVGIGVTHAFTLASSQVITTLPEWFSRAVVAGSVAVAVPAAFVAWRTHSPIPAFSAPPERESSA